MKQNAWQSGLWQVHFSSLQRTCMRPSQKIVKSLPEFTEIFSHSILSNAILKQRKKYTLNPSWNITEFHASRFIQGDLTLQRSCQILEIWVLEQIRPHITLPSKHGIRAHNPTTTLPTTLSQTVLQCLSRLTNGTSKDFGIVLCTLLVHENLQRKHDHPSQEMPSHPTLKKTWVHKI